MVLNFRSLFVILVSLSSLNRLAAEGVSWSKLEVVLRGTPGRMFDAEALMSALEGQHMGVRTNAKMLSEMAVQSTYPYVAIAGLAGLHQINPALGYRVSLNHLWCSTNIGSPLLLPFLQYLTNSIASRDFLNAFSAVALFESRNISSMVIVIQQIPSKPLAEWLFSDEKTGSITVEALVIDRLISARDQLTPDQLRKIRIYIQNLRHCPGIPRAIFLLHSDDGSVSLASSIEALVEDTTIDITLKQMLFRKYAKRLNGVLNIDRMKVSDRERERYRNWLLKYSESE